MAKQVGDFFRVIFLLIAIIVPPAIAIRPQAFAGVLAWARGDGLTRLLTEIRGISARLADVADPATEATAKSAELTPAVVPVSQQENLRAGSDRSHLTPAGAARRPQGGLFGLVDSSATSSSELDPRAGGANIDAGSATSDTPDFGPASETAAQPPLTDQQLAELSNLEGQLQAAGVEQYSLERWGDGRTYRFTARARIPAAPRLVRYLEAKSADPAEAMEQVLWQILEQPAVARR